jgi:catechol 2,3-dioxygenase-like lactoylglutathione lyase family enzyme
MEQRLSLITLGIADLDRARRFYEALGWKTGAEEGDDVVFFQGAAWSSLSGTEPSWRRTARSARAAGGEASPSPTTPARRRRLTR